MGEVNTDTNSKEPKKDKENISKAPGTENLIRLKNQSSTTNTEQTQCKSKKNLYIGLGIGFIIGAITYHYLKCYIFNNK